MTEEEWIEEVFHYAAELGKYNELHKRLDELVKLFPNKKFQERVQIAYFEMTESTEIVEVSNI
jgi:hypothetical protein